MLDNAEYHAGSEGQAGVVCQPRHPPRLDGGGGAGTLVWSSDRHGAQDINCPQNGIDHADGSCLRIMVRRKRESP